MWARDVWASALALFLWDPEMTFVWITALTKNPLQPIKARNDIFTSVMMYHPVKCLDTADRWITFLFVHSGIKPLLCYKCLQVVNPIYAICLWDTIHQHWRCSNRAHNGFPVHETFSSCSMLQMTKIKHRNAFIIKCFTWCSCEIQ